MILARMSPEDQRFVLWARDRILSMTPDELAEYGVVTSEVP